MTNIIQGVSVGDQIEVFVTDRGHPNANEWVVGTVKDTDLDDVGSPYYMAYINGEYVGWSGYNATRAIPDPTKVLVSIDSLRVWEQAFRNKGLIEAAEGVLSYIPVAPLGDRLRALAAVSDGKTHDLLMEAVAAVEGPESA